MRAYPEPENPVRRVHTEGAVVQANAYRAESTDALESKGAVCRIGLEELEALVGQGADSRRQCLITPPEAR